MITNQKESALKVLKRVYAFNTGEPQEVFPFNVTHLYEKKYLIKFHLIELSGEKYQNGHVWRHAIQYKRIL